MPSLRRHIITGEEILFAPERAGRPNAFGNETVDACPFCPGNEAMTPPEIEHRGDPWHVRVFPNKYPSVAGHEVIVESRDHDATFDAIRHAPDVVETWISRYRAHERAAHVAIFTNDGARAGASIDHLHSQVMPLEFVPPRVARETTAFAQGATCPLCAALEDHARDGLLIDDHGSFVRIAPRGSIQSYEQWIVPSRHIPAITSFRQAETEEFAVAMQRAVAGTRRIAGAYNVLLMNFAHATSAHFYAAIVPRLSAIAGFELATGTFIDIIDPAAAARALR
jgi:UDPglucose--hexose-1-phosphate uridylyltransferase